MDENKNLEFDPIPEEEGLFTFESEEPAGETLYHGAGVGQTEPIYTAPVIPEPEPIYTAPVMPEPEPVRRSTPPQWEPPAKPKKSGGKGILAAVLAVALAAGSCGITAWSVNRKWEDRTAQLENRFQTQVDQLQAQMEELAALQSGIGTSGTPVANGEGLTPSQVYAKNVGSVVAISNQTTTNVWGQVSETASSGTGFVLTADGYILSNYHVVEGASRLTVMTYMGNEYEAKLIGYDAVNDVAILKVEATDLTPVTIGSSADLIVGDQVVAIGNPLGELTSSLSVGYISAKDRTINTDGNLIDMMQTDAAINPGNSGGPLFNMKGEVIGITTAKYSGSTGSGASIEGIGFAIPIDDVMNMAGDLMEHGYLTNQAYLGVSVREMDSSTAAMYSLPTGAYVVGVTEGSCAETAGILPKDIIIGVGQYSVESRSGLTNVLRKFKAGDTTTVTVYRSGQEVELSITFDVRPQDPDADLQQPQGQGEMPSAGSYEDWYNYFFPFFGGRG